MSGRRVNSQQSDLVTDKAMTSQQRFLRTISYENPGRPPLWREDVADETLAAWRNHGPSSLQELRDCFPFDPHEIVEMNVWPIPAFQHGKDGGFGDLRGRYRPDIAERLPKDLEVRAKSWADRDYPLGIILTRGFFQACGVRDWKALEAVLHALYDSPREIEATMAGLTEMVLTLLESVFTKVNLDFAVFSEPIASFHAPVISPKHYREFCIPHYSRLIEALRRKGVKVLVVRTWGMSLPLIPCWLELGINTLWNDHCQSAGVDYRLLRREFGKELRLIGGIDSRALSKGKAAIDSALERTLPPLLDSGGYLPMLDDRVRQHVPFDNYCYYRQRLSALAGRNKT